jgi:hypothetical protein
MWLIILYSPRYRNTIKQFSVKWESRLFLILGCGVFYWYIFPVWSSKNQKKRNLLFAKVFAKHPHVWRSQWFVVLIAVAERSKASVYGPDRLSGWGFESRKGGGHGCLSVSVLFCYGPIPRSDRSCRVWRVSVWSTNLKNEVTLAHVGLLSQKKNKWFVLRPASSRQKIPIKEK